MSYPANHKQRATPLAGFVSPVEDGRCEAASCARHWKSTGPSDHLGPLNPGTVMNSRSRAVHAGVWAVAGWLLPFHFHANGARKWFGDVCVLEEQAVETFANADDNYACFTFIMAAERRACSCSDHVWVYPGGTVQSYGLFF